MKVAELFESIRRPINGVSITKSGDIDVSSLIKRHDALLYQDPKHLFHLMDANDELEIIDYILDNATPKNGTIPSDTFNQLIQQYQSEHPRDFTSTPSTIW